MIGAKLDFFRGRAGAAARSLIEVCRALPTSVDAHHLLGVILSNAKNDVAAIKALARAYQLSPDDAEICSNVGAVLVRQDDFNRAEPILLKARDLDPHRADARNNLGILFQRQLRHAEAVQEFSEAVRLAPDRVAFRNSLVRALDYCPGTDPREDFEAARSAGELIEKNHPVLFDSYAPEAARIRIGYIGSTLRTHSVEYYMLPILEGHSDEFHVSCYHIGDEEDSMTARISAAADRYRHLPGQSAESIARRIHDDCIDILVDLEGFSGLDLTLGVSAHSPARLQVSYLGWPNTTALSRISYRFVDHHTDPAGGMADRIYTERLIRMTPSLAVYAPPVEAPDVAPPPAVANGYVTFGSFNLPKKMNPDVIGLWTRILRDVPGSKLLLKHPEFGVTSTAENIRSAFEQSGIDRQRLLLATFERDTADHLGRYQEVDIGLDPFPFNGMTTTCEALWMGVPVITLAGDKHLARVGVSLMNNIDHPEWIAKDMDRYAEIARELASDHDRLGAVRAGLRARMLGSPLMDYAGFVRELERQLKTIWRGSA